MLYEDALYPNTVFPDEGPTGYDTGPCQYRSIPLPSRRPARDFFTKDGLMIKLGAQRLGLTMSSVILISRVLIQEVSISRQPEQTIV